MAFIRHKGKTKFVYLPMTPSTAVTKGTLMSFTSGKLVAATSSSASADIVGVLRHTIASTDTDYALDRLVEVEVPVERYVEWTADVTASLAATDVLKEVDLTDGATVNPAASSIKAVRCSGFISTTKGQFYVKFLGSY